MNTNSPKDQKNDDSHDAKSDRSQDFIINFGHKSYASEIVKRFDNNTFFCFTHVAGLPFKNYWIVKHASTEKNSDNSSVNQLSLPLEVMSYKKMQKISPRYEKCNKMIKCVGKENFYYIIDNMIYICHMESEVHLTIKTYDMVKYGNGSSSYVTNHIFLVGTKMIVSDGCDLFSFTFIVSCGKITFGQLIIDMKTCKSKTIPANESDVFDVNELNSSQTSLTKRSFETISVFYCQRAPLYWYVKNNTRYYCSIHTMECIYTRKQTSNQLNHNSYVDLVDNNFVFYNTEKQYVLIKANFDVTCKNNTSSDSTNKINDSTNKISDALNKHDDSKSDSKPIVKTDANTNNGKFNVYHVLENNDIVVTYYLYSYIYKGIVKYDDYKHSANNSPLIRSSSADYIYTMIVDTLFKSDPNFSYQLMIIQPDKLKLEMMSNYKYTQFALTMFLSITN